MKKEQRKLHVNHIEPENESRSMIGSRCRQRRDELKLSRNKVADMVGVSLSTLQAWENQEREPTASDIIKLANILNVSAAWLLSGEEACVIPQKSSINQATTPVVEQDFDTQAVQQRLIAIISALEASEAERLSKLLALNGAKYLSRLLDSENLELIQLEGNKRKAALLLDSLSEDRIREILSEIEAGFFPGEVNAKAG